MCHRDVEVPFSVHTPRARFWARFRWKIISFASLTRKKVAQEKCNGGIKFVVGIGAGLVGVSVWCVGIPRCEEFLRKFWMAVGWVY